MTSLTVEFVILIGLLGAIAAVADHRRVKRLRDEAFADAGREPDPSGLLPGELFDLHIDGVLDRMTSSGSDVDLLLVRLARGDVESCAREIAGELMRPVRGYRVGNNLIAVLTPPPSAALIERLWGCAPAGYVEVERMSAPRDGTTLDELLDAAAQRAIQAAGTE